MKDNKFFQGVCDGLPICFGYITVSFTFGMMAAAHGIPVLYGVLISAMNVTSAGQFAGLALIMSGASYLEMALTQLVINMRYALMSLSLSQKLHQNINVWERCLIAYGNTDEIFAVASSVKGAVEKAYMYGLIFISVSGWILGTFLGGVANTLLPESIRSPLGIAIYGMFLAIIIPPSKKSKAVLLVIAVALVLSCMISLWSMISSGFVIIICTIVAAGLGGILCPIGEGGKA